MTAYLLDTHTFIWWAENSPRLSRTAKQAIELSQAPIYVSAVTAWEIILKQRLGKLTFRGELDRAGSISEAIAFYGFTALPLTVRYTEFLYDLPRHHNDPFDHMLITQALVEGLTMISHDRVFHRYDVPVLWA